MTTTASKRATDHQAPTSERFFSFTHEGKEYTFPHPMSKVTSPGFIRRNRRRDEVDLGFTALEELAGETKKGQECLNAIDAMSPEQFNKLMDELWEFADMPVGE